MKKFILPLLLFFLLATPARAAEKISIYSVELAVQANSDLRVKEKILYDFGGGQKHGIYRDLPVKYQARGGNYNLRISDISVTDGQGQALNFSSSHQSNNLQIKIGEADQFVSGQKVYQINYTVKRALNYFNNYDELYWNAIGANWLVPIDYAQVLISFPTEISISNIQRGCFAGPENSQITCDESGLTQTADQSYPNVIFKQKNLSPGEGLTIVVGWPKGIVTPVSFWQNLKYTLADNWILFLPLLVLAFMYYLWHTKGKDPIGRVTIIPEYDPPAGLSPAEVGALIDEHVHSRDISAEIIHLAVLGYLKIKRLPSDSKFKKDDYEFTKLKDEANLPNSFQKQLMTGLFATLEKIKLSALKNNFYKDWAVIKKGIWKSLVAKKYFSKSPLKVRSTYSLIGAIIIFAGSNFCEFLGGLATITVLISGIIVLIFGFFMPVKTRAGVLAKEHSLGFKNFLKVTETERLKFHNTPTKDPQMFEKFLPYAMAFQVEKGWAEQFAGLYNQSPSWYSDPAGNNFSALYLASSLNNFSASAHSQLTSRPSSSAAAGGSGFSGGFSGGGFGGGGGGSW